MKKSPRHHPSRPASCRQRSNHIVSGIRGRHPVSPVEIQAGTLRSFNRPKVTTMKTIRQILESKGRDIWSISPRASVYEAIEMMAEKGVGALLVMDVGSLVGIISERDYARKVILKGKASKKIPVSEVMTKEVIVGSESETVERVMALMTEKRIRHLPIVEAGDVTGVVSLGDMVKARLADQQFKIEQLQSYIMG